MPETDTQMRPNTVTIEDAGPSRKKLKIEVPAETVSEKLGESLDTLVVEAQLPGFRKGHAPRKLLEKRFGKDVRKEAKNQIVASAYSEAIDQHKLQVVGDPVAEQLAEVEIEDGKPLIFEIEVETLPEFELPSLDGVSIKKPTFEVTDDMVADEVSKLCINEGDLESRDVAEPGDYLTGDSRMVDADDDSTEFYNIPGAVIQKPTKDKDGKGMILGVMVDDFDKQIGKPKVGDELTVTTTGPDNHENEALRGKKLKVTFTVTSVDRIIPAKLEDVLAQYGFSDEAQLRQVVRERLEQRVAVQQQSAMRQQAARYLLENTEMALPERLTAQQAARTLERQRMELMYRGADPAQIEEHIAELRASSAARAQQDLKLFFMLNRVAKDLEVKVDEREINARIAQMAFSRGVRPDQLRQELIQTNRIGQVFAQVQEHKALDAIVGKATITEVSAEEFNKTAAAGE
ncbi:MAG: trigger factor [Phycisphaerales bacterium JB039]